ncbi:uncharacterized protein LOC126905834 isoform X2 [Daktulosphaira vitifoliae]|uniref:uncharacterized protein LOC126905834 isoform X2 n=1 Tax=Daktulosphaira vitifoliae TaxID=58002 RepID=UPI0021AA78AC|nr:uncharacterized protein LOC126905834 isoform X2 [Daktulosphaira vitifoliae]XP_050541887.1 uncharacterized protein LOC126905834 isoform X2 [Daktulosphaira vitifoliae]
MLLWLQYCSSWNACNSYFIFYYLLRAENEDAIKAENQYLSSLLNKLVIHFLFLYVNYHLRKATYEHNVQIIYQWLVVNNIYFVFSILVLIFATFRLESLEIFMGAIPVVLLMGYSIYIVQCFYQDELKFLNNHCSTTTITVNGPPYATLNSTIPNTHYIVQPPIIQHPVHQAPAPPYPQQSYASQPPQYPHIQIPQFTEPQPPEFCNPPPYSPYSGTEGTSTK